MAAVPSVDNAQSEPDLRVVPTLLSDNHIPLSAISQTLHLMLRRLNDESVRIVEVDGIEVMDNVHGLAELLLISNSVMDFGRFTNSELTVAAVLDAWGRQDQRASCSRLWHLLASLGRYDVLREIRARLLADAKIYLEQLRRQRPPSPEPAPPQDQRRFDVYVSYCENSHEDATKAAEIVQRLRDHGLEVVSAEDRLAGVFALEEYHQLVGRCKRILILWSRAYHSDEELVFELNHARSTDPAAVRRRVIPVLLDDTPLPGHLMGIVSVRFGHRACVQKLVRSLQQQT